MVSGVGGGSKRSDFVNVLYVTNNTCLKIYVSIKIFILTKDRTNSDELFHSTSSSLIDN